MKKSWKDLKVAIYYDWLNQWGGAEKVLLDILELFPKAQLFTLFCDPKNTPWLPSGLKIHSSFIKNPSPIFSPFYDIAAESFNLTAYDLVIATTTNVGHSLLTSPESLFVCYYHNFNRHLYRNQNKFLSPLLSIYQKIDHIYSRRPDYSFCNSETVQKRLSDTFDILAKVIYPGIDIQYFTPITSKPKNYFLIVNRLVPYKNIDYVIETFQTLPYTLKIVGVGRDLGGPAPLSGGHVRFTVGDRPGDGHVRLHDPRSVPRLDCGLCRLCRVVSHLGPERAGRDDGGAFGDARPQLRGHAPEVGDVGRGVGSGRHP
ncbi:MAG: Glycosyl transferase group 1, partial [Microgenomates group bacterium GW2011_GWA2_40_6]